MTTKLGRPAAAGLDHEQLRAALDGLPLLLRIADRARGFYGPVDCAEGGCEHADGEQQCPLLEARYATADDLERLDDAKTALHRIGELARRGLSVNPADGLDLFGRIADLADGPAAAAIGGRAQVVTICGSTRFRAEIAEANRMLTLAGHLVLAPGVFGHDGDEITEQQKQQLDRLHLAKIDLAGWIYVVNPGGYIGESTRREIDYARRTGKGIVALVDAGVDGASPAPWPVARDGARS
ncbi:hypothetical protein [Paractinoplanes atraurantiacus]|uniref:Uncharacterized protein n=1 Tax=Paractinoplanes atraurantiacus TaxID=1036182 RepID=A0A285KJZ6_9ACTN|nr:hypothetical protein [Actinoplanes atraurantiacus]SNY72925.1 hypothetical protein SAMN05421748_14461 [Actinoplanes atraurantiacus]